MASVTCIYCRAENEPGEQLCRACFRKLPPESPVAPVPDPPTGTGEWQPPDPPQESLPQESLPQESLPQESLPPADASATCPHCGADVPDPRNRVCVECHRSLAHPQPLRLGFPGGEVTVDSTGPVKLGRDPASSPVWSVFADHDNVSRLHATVGVDARGGWIRDERSLNGTYVNDVPVPPGTRIALADGDTLRLAADVTATVQFARHESPP